MPLRSHFSILPHATERYDPSPAIALDTDGNDGSHTIMQPPVTPPLEVPVPPAGTSVKIEHQIDLSRIAQDLQIRRVQVESVVQLLDEGNTIPFITRYRKERTGGLNEEFIRQIQGRVAFQRQLADRRQMILKSVEGQGKLSDELRAALIAAETVKRLEDLYMPYKPKKRTLATTARERGLEPFALALWNRDPAVANLAEVLPGMVNPEKELATVEDVMLGAQHILAELVAETADVRAAVRRVIWETGKLATTKSESLRDGQGLEYKDYFQFGESVRHIPPHRILAINRGEKENALRTHLEWDQEAVRRAACSKLPLADHPHAEFLAKVIEDALTRLLLPSLEREVRRELSDESEDHAVRIFARNLRSLLLQPPLRGRRVLAIDPGFRTGCKLAALDETGNLLDETVIYPFAKPDRHRPKPPDKPEADKPKSSEGEQAVTTPVIDTPTPSAPEAVASDAIPATSGETTTATPAEAVASTAAAPAEVALLAASAESATSPPVVADAPGQVTPPRVPRLEAIARLEEMVRKHHLNVVAIGNGTACRETEELISELIQEKLPDLAYVIVNEAGASYYSTSAVGREEFPTFDATLRGTISIGRRLQDPLSELVKIDPQNIGVGLYQHDCHPKRLKESLEAIIESCVNHVGVDVNTASVPLLRHVSGLNQLAARELVDYRKQHGPFKTREQFLQVPGIGQARFVQAAGFLKIPGGDNPLDETWVHPESYAIAGRLLEEVGGSPELLRHKEHLDELRQKMNSLAREELCSKLAVGQPTLMDICEALARPGRDPREDLPPPIFKKGVLKLEDLQAGMELKGTVLNVVDFGAFVDIGLKDSGLVHISQMANKYVKNPYEIVSVGDVVTVWVLAVDQERKRVSLSMIKPGTDRKPPERKPEQPRNEQQGQGPRQPRGRRPQPQGRRPVGPAPRHQGKPHEAAPAPAPQPAPPPPGRPRKPHRATPKPKLSKAALEGDAPLRTFSELKAFFEAQKQKEPESTQPAGEAGTSQAPPAQEHPPS